MKVVAFNGSPRMDGNTTILIHHVFRELEKEGVETELVPPDATLEIFDLEGIPPFNQDLETQPPGKVREFKAKIKAADALLIVTPEYNYSIPGVLKNAIDSASRPHGDNAFEGKPVAIMGASIGMLGTARAQYHLRQTRTKFPINLHWRQRYLKILLTFRRTL